MTIERYTPQQSQEWDKAVETSRNGTFLHMRAYMDYHADRFRDFSLLARDNHGDVIAVLPANADGDNIHSHQGLTFGGWLMSSPADANAMMDIWGLASKFLRTNGFKRLIYKPVPHIYHKYPAEEDLYALFRAGGSLTRHSSLRQSTCRVLSASTAQQNGMRNQLKRPVSQSRNPTTGKNTGKF